jgi:aspartate/methionine/tyrosine aminotransferase
LHSIKLYWKEMKIDLNNINENVLKAEYAVRGEIVNRALEIEKELKNEKNEYKFKEIIYCNIGNPIEVGQKHITYHREVLSLVDNPKLLENELVDKIFKKDVIKRAKEILKEIKDSGSYSNSIGHISIRKKVANFIKERDGFDSDEKRIFISNGASSSIQNILKLIIRDKKDGILIPIPQYPLYSATIELYGGTQIGYFLNEEKNWSLEIEDVEKSYQEAIKNDIIVRAIVIINPGNPTGNVLTIENQKEIIKFCEKKEICLLADEVYQENIYNDLKFVSFKKIMKEMNSKLELFSFHSCSKGFLGECGRRGG